MKRRAGVSSFGFGGANYHCVLEEAEAEHGGQQQEQKKSYRMNNTPFSVVVHAPSPAALLTVCE